MSSVHRSVVVTRHRRVACVTLMTACVAVACTALKGKDEPADVVARRVIGMPLGTFADRYGPVGGRTEQLDGSTTYGWESATGAVAAGPYGPDERVCRLLIKVDGVGRIAEAVVALDQIGRASTSRCKEIFLPA